MATYICGCINTSDPHTGILHCLHKCDFHKLAKECQPTGLKYYINLGTVTADGKPNPFNYLRELKEALGEVPFKQNGLCLEIGCGMSPYVEYLKDRGYNYLGIDTDKDVAEWMWKTYGVEVCYGSFPEKCVEGRNVFDLIFSAHALEHLEFAPEALRSIHRLLKPGGLFYLIVPDSSDPTNPDHLWFFEKGILYGYLNTLGFQIEKIIQKQVVQKENFIYVKAIKK